MRLFELFDSKEKNPELDYNIQDDLIYFINNDSNFYRRTYYPFIHKVKARFKSNKPVNIAAFATTVNQAYDQYKQQFPIVGQPEQLSNNDLREICAKLHNDELKDFKSPG